MGWLGCLLGLLPLCFDRIMVALIITLLGLVEVPPFSDPVDLADGNTRACGRDSRRAGAPPPVTAPASPPSSGESSPLTSRLLGGNSIGLKSAQKLAPKIDQESN